MWRVPCRVVIFILCLFGFLVLAELYLLGVQLEVESPAEGRLLVKAPVLLDVVGQGHPCLLVEALGFLETAEEQRQGELPVDSVLRLMDEVDHLEVFVQTPGPEVVGVDVSCSYPDFHVLRFRRCIEVRP